MIDPGAERWRRLTVKEGWRRFVDDEPTVRPERMRLGDYRRLDERSRSVYDLERLRHAHGFGPIRSLYGGMPKVGPRGIWQQDSQGLLSDPACCTHRVVGRLCRAELAVADSRSVSPNNPLTAAQRRLDAILAGQLQPRLAGVERPAETYLRDLLWLCALLDRYARAPRDRASPERLGRRVQHDPAELAAALPEALELADLPDPDALAEALRELASRRYRACGQTLPATTGGRMSEQLKAVVQRAASQAVWAPASRQLGIHPSVHRHPEDLDPRLGARHVPQLFWDDDYHREIHELFDFDDVSHRYGRRFCSVLLARMLTPLTWHAAVRHLDFPEQFITGSYNTTFATLRTNGRFDELAARVKRIANQHAHEQLIDYKQRRVRLAGWSGIDVESWHLLKPRPRPRSPRLRGEAPVIRARASVWLWCHLTSGHERASPIPLPRNPLVDQTRFIQHGLLPLQERLLILGELLLDTPAEAHSTLHNRLAGALHRLEYLARRRPPGRVRSRRLRPRRGRRQVCAARVLHRRGGRAASPCRSARLLAFQLGSHPGGSGLSNPRADAGVSRPRPGCSCSSQARASPITAAFVAEGNCGEPLGGPVPSAAFAGERSADCWTARSTGQHVCRPERASRAALGVSQVRRQVRPTRLRDADPNRGRDETSRRYASSTAGTRSPNPRSAGSTSPFLVARDGLGRRVGAGSRQPPSACSTRGSLRARGRRLFGGAGAVGE